MRTMQEDSFDDYKKLSPKTLLYRLITNIPSAIIPAWIVGGNGLAEFGKESLILLLVLMVVTPSIMLHYFFYKYRINERDLSIISGVFAKKHRTIPIEKIQNVRIEQNFLQKMLGLAKVEIETAGDIAAEAKLEFVNKESAEELKLMINNLQSDTFTKQSLNDSDLGQTQIPVAEDVYKMPLKDIIKHGMLRFRPMTLIFGAWAFSTLQQFGFQDQIDKIVTEDSILQLEALSGTELAIYVTVGVLIALLSSWILDILLTINQFYNFNIEFKDGKLFVKHGLFVTKNYASTIKKIQVFAVRTNPIRRLFGFFSLAVESAGTNAEKLGREYLLPLSTLDKVSELTTKYFGFSIEQDYKNTARVSIRRRFVSYLIVYGSLIAALCFADLYFLLGLVLVPLLYLLAKAEYGRHGYIISADKIYIRNGLFFQSSITIPAEKYQACEISSSIFQRRLGLADFHIYTAAMLSDDACVIHDLPLAEAWELKAELDKAFKEHRRKLKGK